MTIKPSNVDLTKLKMWDIAQFKNNNNVKQFIADNLNELGKNIECPHCGLCTACNCDSESGYVK